MGSYFRSSAQEGHSVRDLGQVFSGAPEFALNCALGAPSLPSTCALLTLSCVPGTGLGALYTRQTDIHLPF